jgi:hypothetical protein
MIVKKKEILNHDSVVELHFFLDGTTSTIVY